MSDDKRFIRIHRDAAMGMGLLEFRVIYETKRPDEPDDKYAQMPSPIPVWVAPEWWPNQPATVAGPQEMFHRLFKDTFGATLVYRIVDLHPMFCERTACRISLTGTPKGVKIWNQPSTEQGYRVYCVRCARAILNGSPDLKWENFTP